VSGEGEPATGSADEDGQACGCEALDVDDEAVDAHQQALQSASDGGGGFVAQKEGANATSADFDAGGAAVSVGANGIDAGGGGAGEDLGAGGVGIENEAAPSPDEVSGEGEPATGSADEDGQACGPEDAAREIILRLGVSSSSVLFVAGDTAPGSLIIEDAPELERPAVELAVPSGTGQYYAFFIDDAPLMRYEHPVRYAWYHCESGLHGSASAEYPMTIMRPTEPPRPFIESVTSFVDNVETHVGLGDFAASPLYDQTDAEPAMDLMDNPDAPNPPQPPPVLAPPVVFSKCIHRALVIDAGDKAGIRGAAADFAKDADRMTDYLKRVGFDVVRRSNNWHDKKLPIQVGSGLQDIKTFMKDTDQAIRKENKLGAADKCVKHEVFIYVSSHGSKQGSFILYDADGEGKREMVQYKDIVDTMTNFQNNVTFYSFVDACYSGTYISKGKPERLTNGGKFAAYVLTAVDAESTAAVGNNVFVDSATEDFIDGLGRKDWDGDGQKPDDIGDGYGEMVNDGSSNPMRWRSPDKDDRWYFSLELFKPEQVEYQKPKP
jgi:hypothetical protein